MGLIAFSDSFLFKHCHAHSHYPSFSLSLCGKEKEEMH
jgi:hypothetical protein